MPFVLLLFLALISLQSHWPKSPFGLDAGMSLLVTVGGIMLLWVSGGIITNYYRREIVRDPGNRRWLTRRFHAKQRGYFIVLTGFFAAALYLFGWGWTVKEEWSEQAWLLPGMELVLLGPLFMGLVCSWARFYDVEKITHDADLVADLMVAAAADGPLPKQPAPFLSRWAYVALQVRFNFLLVVPPLFLMICQEIIFKMFPALRESASIVFTLVFLGFAFLSIPWLLRIFLGLYPLPLGPLRDRLEATARRVGFRCNDILLWDTRHCMANAMVTGVLPGTRYIVLTDRLIAELSTEEVEAVLGHEIGHVKHHHMFFYTLFLLGSLLVLGILWQTYKLMFRDVRVDAWLGAWAPWLGAQLDWEMFEALPPLLFGGLYIYLVFGCLSRFCERQADICGCRTVSFQAFINALEKVAVLNGIHREKPGWFSAWRHPSIARRVDFLQRMQEDPQLESRFQRRFGLIKWSMALGLSAVLGIMLWFGEVYKVNSSP